MAGNELTLINWFFIRVTNPKNKNQSHYFLKIFLEWVFGKKGYFFWYPSSFTPLIWVLVIIFCSQKSKSSSVRVSNRLQQTNWKQSQLKTSNHGTIFKSNKDNFISVRFSLVSLFECVSTFVNLIA